MKGLYSIIVVFFLMAVSTSCGKNDQKTHFTYYFFENKTSAKLKITNSLISPSTDTYCDDCFVEPGAKIQLASNITALGDTPPYQTFDRINIYRNDSIKSIYNDSAIVHFPWEKIVRSETITDYTFILDQL